MHPRTIIVTGANRGIGRAICEVLIQKFQTTGQPLRLVAASRTGDALGLPSHDNLEIMYPQLDIINQESVDDLTNRVRGPHGSAQPHRTIDVLINNAGVRMEDGQGKGDDLGRTRQTLAVNYHGTKRMCLSTIRHLTPNTGRIVNLSSVASFLAPYSDVIQARFRDPHATWQHLDTLADDYLTSVQHASEQQAGFAPARAYNVSKSLVNAMTSLLARENPGLIVNACCPGWIDTDMGRTVTNGRTKPPKSVHEGAKIPVRLAIGELNGITGKYWANSSIRSTDEGEVQQW